MGCRARSEDQGGKGREVDGSRRGRQRGERNVSWWSLKIAFGHGWFKLGKSEPETRTLATLGLE